MNNASKSLTAPSPRVQELVLLVAAALQASLQLLLVPIGVLPLAEFEVRVYDMVGPGLALTDRCMRELTLLRTLGSGM